MKKIAICIFFLLIFVPNVIAGEFFLASRNYNTYHDPDCKWAKNIKPENLIIFQSAEEAVKAGFIPCKFCLQTVYATN